MTFNKTLLTALSALALGVGASVGTAVAQEPAPTPEAQAPAAAPSLEDDKLQSFAVAFLEVSKVTQEYQPKIAAAGTPEDQQKLQQEAGEKMVEVVNSSEGINVEEYNMIIQAAQTDPELAQRINGHITQAAGGGAAQPQPAPEAPAQE